MATQVTVTGTFPAGSTVDLRWRLSGFMFDSAGALVWTPKPITWTGNDQLPAVDDSGTTPSGLVWHLEGTVDGETFAESYEISHTMAPTVALWDLSPAQPASELYSFALQSALLTETARAETAEAQGWLPAVTANVGQGPTVALTSPQWAIGSDGNGYWLAGNAVPTGSTAAALGPDLKLYPIGAPA